MAKTLNKSKASKARFEEFAKVLIFIRHVRNDHGIQENYLRVNAADDAEKALELALGEDMDMVYKSKTWKNS